MFIQTPFNKYDTENFEHDILENKGLNSSYDYECEVILQNIHNPKTLCILSETVFIFVNQIIEKLDLPYNIFE